jgi:hypothetical protein
MFGRRGTHADYSSPPDTSNPISPEKVSKVCLKTGEEVLKFAYSSDRVDFTERDQGT